MNYLKLIVIFLIPFIGTSQENKHLTNTYIADSLDIIGEYVESLKYRELALEEKNHSKDYKIYLKAKWHYTNSCIYEMKGGQENHREALKNSLEAKRLIAQIVTDEKKYYLFNHHIANRYYHQYKWIGKLQDALKGVQDEYDILKDTLPEHDIRILYTIDSRGFLNTLLEDPERANDYFLWSLPLYKKYHPENLRDIYLNYNEMVINYRKLGLRNQEHKLLLDAENYWTNISDAEDAYYYQNETYERLANWNMYYGNIEVAESYLFKQESLFDSISKLHKPTEKEALINRRLLTINENYIELYLKIHEYEKAKKYLNKSKELLKNSERYYRWEVEQEIKTYFFESQLPEKNYDEKEELLLKAIHLAKQTEKTHFVESLAFQIKLYEFYVKNNKTNEALRLLSDILSNENEVDDNLKFRLLCLKQTLPEKDKNSHLIEKEYEEAFGLLLNDKKPNFSFLTVDIKELKEFYTYTTLNGILQIADFYLNLYTDTTEEKFLDIAYNMYLLASDFLGKIYVGDNYNSNLFDYYKHIENGLVNCALLKNETDVITTSIQAIENNASKLTWSKFIYNKSKQKLKVSDSLIEEELRLKSTINYYQNELHSKKKENKLSHDSLKLRVTYLKTKLRQHQEFIRKKYGNFYSNTNQFNIEDFKNQLDVNQVVLKFSFVKNDLIVYEITDNNCSIKKIASGKEIKSNLENYINALSTHNTFLKLPKELQIISELILKLNKEKISIIPSETLNFIPFETIVPTYFESNLVFNYSLSLSLFSEQMKASEARGLSVGIFTGQDKSLALDVNYLPAISKEINDISKHCKSQIYYQATSENFLENASHYNALHLAMHTTIDIENPELSNFNFYNNELLIGELYNETIQADLAVLSACDSGNGLLYQGEGVQSISRAFTIAGVPSTVMSLWKVDDKATANIMASFYKYLEEGESKDLALKFAKKDYLESGIDKELKHPYYWSAFIISGNTDPFNKKEVFNFWWLTLLLPPLAFIYYRKTKV